MQTKNQTLFSNSDLSRIRTSKDVMCNPATMANSQTVLHIIKPINIDIT